MKKILFSISILSILLIMSCGEDETCSKNGQANDECFDVVAINYSVLNIGGQEGDEAEYITINYQFSPGAQRYGFTISSFLASNNPVGNGTADRILFDTGVNYQATSLVFNGNLNAPASGILTVTFSKVDRQNGLLSGSFTWEGDDTGSSTSSISGSFSDVAVSLVSD